MTTKRARGVEPKALPGAPPLHDSLPWACTACGGWVNHLERIYTDEGLFHDRDQCLTGGRFEELVAKYGCKCGRAHHTFDEDGEDLSYWEMEQGGPF